MFVICVVGLGNFKIFLHFFLSTHWCLYMYILINILKSVALVLAANLSFQLTFHNFLHKEKVSLVLYFTNIQNSFFFI